MKKYLLLPLCFSAASYGATFPANYVCDNGDKVNIMINGAEQRLIYSSSKYGKLEGFLDVFQGRQEHADESIANIHGIAKVKKKQCHTHSRLILIMAL